MKNIYRLILKTKLNFETKEKEKKSIWTFFKLEYSLFNFSFRLFNFIQK